MEEFDRELAHRNATNVIKLVARPGGGGSRPSASPVHGRAVDPVGARVEDVRAQRGGGADSASLAAQRRPARGHRR
ncbi:hypothetical protein J2S46_001263 [Kitasatospora herbaricolor]|nr:hypothetical protein [Kitasatospora herbaricolor]